MAAYSRIFISVLLVFTFNRPAHAEVITTPENFSGAGAEYFVGREYGRPLVQVSLLSGVNRPGVYHVPIQTNLPQLIAFAGGTVNNAEVDDIRIRRSEGSKAVVLTYDLNHVMKSNDQFPVLQDRDTIQIPQATTMDHSLRWVTLIAGMASVALSVSLVNQIAHHP